MAAAGDATSSIRTHSSEPWTCDHCGRAFKSKKSLANHKRRLSNVGKFKCEMCDKAFATAWGLKQHAAVHTKARPFACAICDRRFARRDDLRLHTRRHTGMKKFPCPTCNKTFVTSCELGSHYNRVHLKTKGQKKLSAAIRHSSLMKSNLVDGCQRTPCPLNLSATGCITTTTAAHLNQSEGTDIAWVPPFAPSLPPLERAVSPAAPALPALPAQPQQAVGLQQDPSCTRANDWAWDDVLKLFDDEPGCLGCRIDADEGLTPLPNTGADPTWNNPTIPHNDHQDVVMRCFPGELHRHRVGDQSVEDELCVGDVCQVWKYGHTCDATQLNDLTH
eukprot:m.159081 g.159081  ORF g.159081 m.159081 type:complete len:333 (-) comp11739_c0_seq1:373-1371(-)